MFHAGNQGHLIFKVNSVVDKAMIQLLYQASQAGVRIQLIVRGMCCLRPGIPGVSETITVRSIVGRFLEHSRVFWFSNGGAEKVYLGSADLMVRNLDRRVEILFPVLDQRLVRQLRTEVLETCLADTATARIMAADGSYLRAAHAGGEKPLNVQAELLKRHLAASQRS